MATTGVFFTINGPQGDAVVRQVARRWPWYVVGGLAVSVIGLLLLINIFDAVATLALLVALGLAMQGVDELLNAWRYQPRWPSYLLGVLHIVIAVWAVAWPDITLWALAVVVGIGFIVSGVAELVLLRQFHDDVANRWVFVVLALVTIVTGVLALAWPGATILVLAILLGARVFVEGLSLLMFGLGLRRIHTA